METLIGNIYIYNTYGFSLWIYLFSQVQPWTFLDIIIYKRTEPDYFLVYATRVKESYGKYLDVILSKIFRGSLVKFI